MRRKPHTISFSVPQRPRKRSRCHASSDSFRSMDLKCLIRRLNICLEADFKAAIYFILYFCVFVVFFFIKTCELSICMIFLCSGSTSKNKNIVWNPAYRFEKILCILAFIYTIFILVIRELAFENLNSEMRTEKNIYIHAFKLCLPVFFLNHELYMLYFISLFNVLVMVFLCMGRRVFLYLIFGATPEYWKFSRICREIHFRISIFYLYI